MRKHTTTRWLAAAAIAAAIGGTAGGAFAYFSSTGGGSGSGTVANPAPLVISPGSPLGELSPGTSSDVAVEIDNANPFRVRIGSLVGTGFDVDGTHRSAGCTASSAALSFASQAVDRFVPPRTGSVDGHLSLDLSGALAMGTGAADACQGATFSVFVQVGA
jgi:hypothetical protein